MRRGVVAVVAAAGLLACAPAWGGTATHSELKLSLGSLALPGSSLGIREAGLTSVAAAARPRAHFSITPGKLGYHGGRVKFVISASGATRCSLSSKPRFFAGPNPQRVRCRGKQTFTLPAVAVGLHWSFKFTARNAAGQVSVATAKLALQKPPFAVSRNWSGYVVPSSSPVTAVSGTFTVPRLNCKHTKDAGESIWVGIGGAAGSEPLLQTGVRSDCFGGVQDNNPGWWEQFPPLPETDFNKQYLSISAGDVIQATVMQNSVGGSWTTRLDDRTTGFSGVMTTGGEWGTIRDLDGAWQPDEAPSPTLSYAGGTTAEWIVEDFGFSDGSFAPFADFGKVAFTGLTTSLLSWSLTKAEQVGLGANGLLLAEPSGPDSSGRGFSVTFDG